MLCRRSVVLLMILVSGCASLARAASPRDAMSAVSIRIHDYSKLDHQQVQQAERQVSQIYKRIGVRLDWHTPVRPRAIEAGDGEWPTDGTAAVTIVVLGPGMAGQVTRSVDVAGYAPITREQGGRIAFVIGDRTRSIADEAGVDQAQVLAGVIAHELAHLLMPQRSHSRHGVMRARWAPAEFRSLYLERFSEAEGSSIRQTVRAIGGDHLRVAD